MKVPPTTTFDAMSVLQACPMFHLRPHHTALGMFHPCALLQGAPKRQDPCIAVHAGSIDVTGGLMHTRGHTVGAVHVHGSTSKASLTCVALCSCEASIGAHVDDGASLVATDCCFLPDGPSMTVGGANVNDASVTLVGVLCVRAHSSQCIHVYWLTQLLHLLNGPPWD